MNRFASFLASHRWAITPLAIFALSRLITSGFLATAAKDQVALLGTSPAYTAKFPTPASPGYWGVVSNWDGQWYRSIAEYGYPASLPTLDGVVVQNEWAFYPAYPALVRLVMSVDLSFAEAATLVSLVASATAITMLFRLVSRSSYFTAVAVTVSLCTFPTSPVFQVAYSEGVALLLVVVALWALRGRSYGQFAAAAVALSLTRPIAIALAGVGAVYWLIRWRRRNEDNFGRRERGQLAAAVGLSAASMGVWPLVASIATGEANAYGKTQAAWPQNDGPYGLWANWLVEAITSNPALFPLIAALLLYLALIAASATWGKLGLELRLWSLIYPLYLLVATRPVPSMLRYLMLSVGPLWPFPGVAPDSSSTRLARGRWIFLGAGVVIYLVGQFAWIKHVFVVTDAPEQQMFP